MKKIIFAVVILATSFSLVAFTKKDKTNAAVTFTVNAQKSKVDWIGSKKSDFHTGYFPVKSGAVQVDGGKLVGGSFVIDVAGLKVTDEGGGAKLQGHLSSADFFDISKFGEATFTINTVDYTKADRATIKGDLSLKGIKAPVTFTAIIRNADDKGFFAEAFFPFDRTVFGINYGIGMVDSDVQLAIHIYGTK
ncbi:MAG: YceI family protein [Chitinophagia bacterium]|jgi:polyisoprenoid-binding protein YceI|nr:YceI family protein [Chitinophagia bacterium]